MTVYFRPYKSLSVRPTPRSPRDDQLAAFLEEKTGIKAEIDPKVDYEDWTEPACVLKALIEEGVEIKILPLKALAEAMEDPLVKIPGRECPKMLMGRLQKRDGRDLMGTDFVWPPADNDMANQYGTLSSFTKNAGRKVQLADMPGDPYPCRIRFPAKTPETASLEEAFERLDLGQVVVKQVYPAKSFQLVDLEGSPKEMLSGFWDAFEWQAIAHEGAKASLLVQERVRMSHETRVFVVDGKPVSAAACIEEHTPLVNMKNEQFPGYFELQRNQGVHEWDTKARDALWAFVQTITADISDESPDMRNYVIDIALGHPEKGVRQPLVIEMNPIASSGLYGQDLSRLVPAFIEVAATLDVQPTMTVTSKEALTVDFDPYEDTGETVYWDDDEPAETRNDDFAP